ncbi:hypothetical protein ACFU7Y_05180 [Kitasatospora sp. NPDC057542]|uniref:hypothetical protein n=1 Tax=Kitasatospora sp. NPDC057542 TaxID=3346162 RepID=UPI003689BE99
MVVAQVVGDHVQDVLRGFELLADVSGQVGGGVDQALGARLVVDEVAESVTGLFEGVQRQESGDLAEADLAEGVEADGQGVLGCVGRAPFDLRISDRAGEDRVFAGGLGVRVVDLQGVHAGGVRVGAERAVGGAAVAAGFALVDGPVGCGVGVVAVVELGAQGGGLLGAARGFGAEELDVGVA